MTEGQIEKTIEIQDIVEKYPSPWRKWDLRFLRLAQMWADQCSKDPSTKVGAVIVDKKKRIVGMGYNGFPRGVKDLHERYEDKEIKYDMVVHAEANAILNAVKSVEGCTLYSTKPTCVECTKLIIQSGITEVVFLDHRPEGSSKWNEKDEVMKTMYAEAGVGVRYVEAL